MYGGKLAFCVCGLFYNLMCAQQLPQANNTVSFANQNWLYNKFNYRSECSLVPLPVCMAKTQSSSRFLNWIM